MVKKELPKLPEKEEKQLLKIVPDDFPIENYTDGNGIVVVCVKESDYKAQMLAHQYENSEAIEEIKKILK